MARGVTDRRRARRMTFGALVSTVLASACARPTEPIAPTRGVVATRLSSPMRPRVARSYEVDYLSLPELTPMSEVQAADAAMKSHGEGAAVGALYVDGSDRVLLDIPAPGYVPRSLLGSPGPCRDRTAGTARWQGFSPAERTEEMLPFYRFEGLLASGRCSLSSGHAFRTTARALVPSLLYAYRDARRAGEERLELIGPRGAWTGSSGEAERLDRDAQIFSTVSIRVARGGSASGFIEATAEATCRFARGRPPGLRDSNASGAAADDCAPKNPLRATAALDTPDAPSFDPQQVAVPASDVAYTFGVEVVWPSADRVPSATAYVERVHAAEEGITPPPPSEFTEFLE